MKQMKMNQKGRTSEIPSAKTKRAPVPTARKEGSSHPPAFIFTNKRVNRYTEMTRKEHTDRQCTSSARDARGQAKTNTRFPRVLRALCAFQRPTAFRVLRVCQGLPRGRRWITVGFLGESDDSPVRRLFVCWVAVIISYPSLLLLSTKGRHRLFIEPVSTAVYYRTYLCAEMSLDNAIKRVLSKSRFICPSRAERRAYYYSKNISVIITL